MGLLTADYYTNILKNSAPSSAPLPAAAPVPAPQPAPITEPGPVESFVNAAVPADTIMQPPVSPAPAAQPAVAPAGTQDFFARHGLKPTPDAEQIQKFGGLVGSPEYASYIQAHRQPNVIVDTMRESARNLQKAFGVDVPTDEELDKMDTSTRAALLTSAPFKAVVGMIAGLPKAFATAPLRVAATIISPFEKAARGEPIDPQSMQNDPNRIELPWLGQIPTFYQSYGDAIKSGMGPGAALLQTTANAAGDVAMSGSLVEAMAGAFRPRATLNPGETVANNAPIKQAINQETGVYQPKAQSNSEYYSLPQTVAKEKYAGNSANTFLKVTPAGDGTVEVSVVQTRAGGIKGAVDYVVNNLGTPVKTVQGDFGPEVKLDSSNVTIKAAKEAPVAEAGATPALPEAAPGAPIASITRPLKGFEDRPITPDQIENVSKIGEVNGIDPAIRDSVIKTITGKDNLGELTQKEYSDVAQTLGTFNDLKKYAPPDAVTNLPSRYISPQRYWMRTVEQKTGVPLYSEAYVPIENATRMRNVFRESYRNEAREIFGDYAAPGKGEERRAIFNYMQGDTTAVLDNPNFNDVTKADLIRISTEMRPLYDKLGNAFGIPTDVFLKDYQPHIQNVGGVYQLYKDGQDVPKEMSFFSDFKRHGSTNVQLDDALALFDIYTNAGSNKLFMNPALERVAALGEKVPKNLQGSLKSYVQEKLGYAGPLEEWLNTMGTNIGSKLGLNVPPDIARQLTDVAMSTTYAGAMGLNPGIAVRNALQYDLLAYPRLGPRFYVDAARAALSKEGMAEFKASGFPVNAGSPYGEAVSENSTPLDSMMNRYKQGTQATLGIHSVSENLNRARTYFQVKYQFEDSLSRYNAGKITWPKFEEEMGFSSLNPVDRNIVRQELVSGNIDAAREHLTRDVLDETQFPYRRGSGARVNYGLTGKLTTQFSQWTIEFAHTMKKWLGDGFLRGDFSKLIRFAGASSAINQTFRNNFGFDFSKSTGAGPLNPSFAPLVQSAIDVQQMVQAFQQGNDQEFEKNKDALVREVQSLGIPAGAEANRVRDFVASYKKGPDDNGQYGVYDSRGRLVYRTDFKDLFWTMFGFPSAAKADAYSLNSSMTNATFNRGIEKQHILQLMQQGKMDQAGDLIGHTGIQITADDMKQFYIPLDQRTFQTLPPILKAKFANQVYPQQ